MFDAVLINPPYDGIEDDSLEENLGLAYIAGYLLERKYTVAICDLTGKDSMKEKLSRIVPGKIFGISCYSTTLNSTKEIINYIHNEYPASLIYLGGPHPTALPDETLLFTGAAGVVTGEGEAAFERILHSVLKNKPYKGIIQGIPVRPLDLLPFPSRSLVNRKQYTRKLKGSPSVSLISGRGCPHQCLHCNSIIMGGGSNGTAYRSAENVVKEIRYLKSLGYTKMRFNDDNFTANPGLMPLLDSIEKENISYRIFGCIENLSEDICKGLKESGCEMCSIGIESYNPDNLGWLGKAYTLNYLSNLNNLSKHKITSRVSFMVGLPNDTYNNIKYWFGKARDELCFDEFAVYALIPYPGTAIYNMPEKYGYSITEKNFNKYKQLGINGESSYVLNYHDGRNSFSAEDVRNWHKYAHELLSEKRQHMRNSLITN